MGFFVRTLSGLVNSAMLFLRFVLTFSCGNFLRGELEKNGCILKEKKKNETIIIRNERGGNNKAAVTAKYHKGDFQLKIMNNSSDYFAH